MVLRNAWMWGHYGRPFLGRGVGFHVDVSAGNRARAAIKALSTPHQPRSPLRIVGAAS